MNTTSTTTILVDSDALAASAATGRQATSSGATGSALTNTATVEPERSGSAPSAAAAPGTGVDGSADIATSPEPARFEQGAANSFAIASFVLGLVSIVAGWSFIAPVVGLVLGITALRRGTGERTLALWGVWLNGALLALVALAALALVVLFGFFGFAAVLAA